MARISESHPAIKQARERGLIAAPKRSRRPPPKLVVKRVTARPLAWSVTLEIPTVLLSEMNRRDFWAVVAKRKAAQKRAVNDAFCLAGLRDWTIPLPCRVTITRTGPRLLDGDNAVSSAKFLRDALAAWCLVDDADPRVEWVVGQRAGVPGVTVTIEGGT